MGGPAQWTALARGLTVFRHEAVAALQRLCPRLHAAGEGGGGGGGGVGGAREGGAGRHEYLDHYASTRARWVIETLRGATDGELEGTGGQGQGQPAAGLRSFSRYAKGTHPFIHCGAVAVALLKAEYEVMEAVLPPGGGGAPGSALETTFAQLVAPVIEELCATARRCRQVSGGVADDHAHDQPAPPSPAECALWSRPHDLPAPHGASCVSH